MAGLPYIKFYADQWDADTLGLSALEDGVYFRICKYIWRTSNMPHESRLPLITGLSLDEWMQVREVLVPFFKIEKGVWHHERAKADIMEAFESIAKKSKAGKHSALARAAKKAVEKKNRQSTPVETVVGTVVGTDVGTDVETNDATDDSTGVAAGVSTTREDNTKQNNTREDKTTSVMTHEWTPGKETIKALARDHQITAVFSLPLVREFCLYWVDRGEARTPAHWQSTFTKWVKRKWEQQHASEPAAVS